MAKKRGVFDIDFELENDAEEKGFPAGNPAGPESNPYHVQGHPLQNSGVARRGPMASAISETAEAHTERTSTEASIRAENDALAHEHVRLKKLGLITDLLRIDDIAMSKLTRDRRPGADPELEELKASIRSVGLSNPIRVEQTEDGYELIQGFRRLSAFRELAEETGDPRYRKIPAAMVPRGEPLAELYRKMVDENLVRKDISFGEMAQLALSYAADEGIAAGEAVSTLYASARKQKRSYIRQFARLLEAAQGHILFAEAIPRALGLELDKMLESDPQKPTQLIEALRAAPGRDADAEQRILRGFLNEASKPAVKPAVQSRAKTSLRLPRAEGEARVLASDGKVELRLDRDFSGVSRARLQHAIEAFLNTLDEG